MPNWNATSDAFRHDVHFALRGIRRRPAFTAMVVTTLALGIGANATMFGILDRLLFQAPARIVDPDRVVLFHTRRLGTTDYQTTQPYVVRSVLREQVSDFADVAVAEPTGVVRRRYYPLGRGLSAGRVAGSLVSANFFSLLGVHPAVGRFFSTEEESETTAQKVAVIGYGFWQRQLAGRRDVIGQTLDIGTKRYTIIGVAPEGFTGTELRDVDVWMPIAAAEGLRLPKGRDWATSGDSQWLLVIARLKPGVVAQHATAQANAAFRNWNLLNSTNRSPARIARLDSTVVVLGSIIPGKSHWTWGMSGSSTDVRVSELLSAVALMVLLIACANVANLLLVRALGRKREIAVRLALGINRRRLIAQLLVEGLILSFLSALGALAITTLSSQVVRRWMIGDGAWSGGAVNGHVLVFTASVALVTGIVTSLMPALQSSKPDLTSALKAGSREGSVQKSSTRTVLLVAQAALAIMLLTGSGLFIRSLRNVSALDFGVDVNHALVAQISQGSVGLSNEESRRLFEEFAVRARRLPGVTASAVSVGLPFSLSWGVTLTAPGRELPKVEQNPFQYAVTPGYFDALRIRKLSGRAFTDADREGTEAVAIVNETMARLYWPQQSPIGACIKFGADSMPCTTVIGVVSNTRRQDLVEGLVPQIYRPLAQLSPSVTNSTVSFFGFTLVVGTTGDASALVEPLRRTIQSTTTSVPYANVMTMRALLGRQTRSWELGARVFSAFGVLALALAAVGLFSVVAFTIGQRMHEFGIRTALGARPADLVRLTLIRGVAPAVTGIFVGVGLALLGGRFVGALLFNVSPRDPAVLGLSSVVLLVCAVLASLVPAMRASRVDPTIALRAE